MFRETKIGIRLEKRERRVPSFRNQRAIGGQVAHPKFRKAVLGFAQEFAGPPPTQIFFRQLKPIFHLSEQFDAFRGL